MPHAEFPSVLLRSSSVAAVCVNCIK